MKRFIFRWLVRMLYRREKANSRRSHKWAIKTRFRPRAWLWGVSNRPIQFKSARKIWPLLELLAKITRVLACSCSQNSWKCSRARNLVQNVLDCSKFQYSLTFRASTTKSLSAYLYGFNWLDSRSLQINNVSLRWIFFSQSAGNQFADN